ncbi:hypothetical protein CI610_01644 [invertebrate metagenome]|uniref:Uncharacterized protein n=1 Tax=invertebrate metagenome TaxID=1711999 RepID=A0A2H9T810_9ZZZZ
MKKNNIFNRFIFFTFIYLSLFLCFCISSCPTVCAQDFFKTETFRQYITHLAAHDCKDVFPSEFPYNQEHFEHQIMAITTPDLINFEQWQQLRMSICRNNIFGCLSSVYPSRKKLLVFSLKECLKNQNLSSYMKKLKESDDIHIKALYQNIQYQFSSQQPTFADRSRDLVQEPSHRQNSTLMKKQTEEATVTIEYPLYQTETNRLASFFHSEWPKDKPDIEQMVQSGFFHYGVADFTRCFFCGGGLKSWEQDDDPDTEHCRWYPECHFMIEKKGKPFISAVRKKQTEHEHMKAEQQTQRNAFINNTFKPTLMALGFSADLVNTATENFIAIFDRSRHTCPNTIFELWLEKNLTPVVSERTHTDTRNSEETLVSDNDNPPTYGEAMRGAQQL